MTLHHVKLVFWNDPKDREGGGEVRNAYTSALTLTQAARKVMRAHFRNSARHPEEVRVLRCPDDHVLWTGFTTYRSGPTLDRGIGEDFEDVPIAEVLS